VSETTKQQKVSRTEHKEVLEKDRGSRSPSIVARESRETEPREPVSSEGKDRKEGTDIGKHTTNSESSESVYTRQWRIAEIAKHSQQSPLNSIHQNLDLEWMKVAYRRLQKDRAPGWDGQSVEEYGKDLEQRLEDLLKRAKSGRYQAPPVRRVHIPKGEGKETRPIGIPTTEDKVLQRAVTMILEPIYEEEFKNYSYGFRPGRSAHQALERIWKEIMNRPIQWIVEVDIRKFFDTLDHGKLREILRQRITDGVIIKLIDKWLKAGVMEGSEIRYLERGSPQGGVISPILSNLFLHEVLDKWFDEVVRERLKGQSFLVRYADDFVMGFQNKEDAERVYRVLPQRFAKYGLKINLEKTRVVEFQRPLVKEKRRKRTAHGSFDFLGFTHYWGKSRKGPWYLKRKTASNRERRTLRTIGQWCRENRHQPIEQQHRQIVRKLQGHYAYYGIKGNSRSISRVRYQVVRIWHKWLNRRSRGGRVITWKRYLTMINGKWKIPTAHVVHS
jgi:RNA-directed DNA polymerase